MPATHEEACDVLRIVTKYLPLDKTQELMEELYREIGMKTDNDSLRQTLKMMNLLADEADQENVSEYVGSARQAVHTINPNRGGLVTYGNKRD